MVKKTIFAFMFIAVIICSFSGCGQTGIDSVLNNKTDPELIGTWVGNDTSYSKIYMCRFNDDGTGNIYVFKRDVDTDIFMKVLRSYEITYSISSPGEIAISHDRIAEEAAAYRFSKEDYLHILRNCNSRWMNRTDEEFEEHIQPFTVTSSYSITDDTLTIEGPIYRLWDQGTVLRKISPVNYEPAEISGENIAGSWTCENYLFNLNEDGTCSITAAKGSDDLDDRPRNYSYNYYYYSEAAALFYSFDGEYLTIKYSSPLLSAGLSSDSLVEYGVMTQEQLDKFNYSAVFECTLKGDEMKLKFREDLSTNPFSAFFPLLEESSFKLERKDVENYPEMIKGTWECKYDGSVMKLTFEDDPMNGHGVFDGEECDVVCNFMFAEVVLVFDFSDYYENLHGMTTDEIFDNKLEAPSDLYLRIPGTVTITEDELTLTMLPFYGGETRVFKRVS